ncbi:Endonuclease/exonuclease/phosphatase [Apiospora marii]|uniref:Endonuclease/exonuclease/phosphatase n=1 Tax=Apiospora marii TaxID=335849 RepID=A0ABR1S3D2_9PEZI
MHSSCSRMGGAARGAAKHAARAYKKEVKKLGLAPHDGGAPWVDQSPAEPGDPIRQNYYIYNSRKPKWEPRTAGTQKAHHVGGGQQLCKLAVYSWNLDFMVPVPRVRKTRMAAALRALEAATGIDRRARPLSSTTATVVVLQGCLQEDLRVMAERPRVRDNFFMTDLRPAKPALTTTMLVDRRLPPSRVFRTGMARDAFCVDVSMAAASAPGGPRARRTIRLCTTHLDGGVTKAEADPTKTRTRTTPPTVRPAQMRRVAGLLKDGSTGVAAGIAAGDFRAVRDYDRTLPADLGLRDAYLALGGEEDAPGGYTWGPQAPRRPAQEGGGEERKKSLSLALVKGKVGCARRDKVCYFDGSGALRLLGFHTFGAGLELPPVKAKEARSMRELGYEKAWITDRIGVMAEFEVVAGPERRE